MLLVCQPGFETFLAKESGEAPAAKGPGWIETPRDGAKAPCFAHYLLAGPAALAGATARQLAQGLTDFFLQTSRDEVFDAPWPLLVEGSGEPGAGKRANAVLELFLELAKK